MRVLFNLKADKPNANGIIYQRDALRKAIKKYNKDVVKTGKAFGEIGQPKVAKHGEQTALDRFVNLSETAFTILKIGEENGQWIADIKILKTPMGKELKKIVKNWENYRIVTLGVGEVNKDKDGNKVVTNFWIDRVGIEPKDNCA